MFITPREEQVDEQNDLVSVWNGFQFEQGDRIYRVVNLIELESNRKQSWINAQINAKRTYRGLHERDPLKVMQEEPLPDVWSPAQLVRDNELLQKVIMYSTYMVNRGKPNGGSIWKCNRILFKLH